MTFQNTTSPQQVLVYENNKGNIIIGELDDLQQIQIEQINFKKEVTKAALIPTEDSLAVVFEEPDFSYLDK